MPNKKQPKIVSVNIIPEKLDETGFHLFISVKANGKKCRFLIDTGASHTVIDKGYFEKNFGKKTLKTVNHSTTGLHSSTAESHFGTINVLMVGALPIKKLNVAAIDLSHVNKTYAQIKKPKIHGILGSDILAKYKMLIDFGSMKLLIP